MTEMHALAGAYALDALPEHEQRQFERHLASCAACRDEVDGLSATAARLAEPEPAPDALREAVMHRVSRTRQLPPMVGSARSRRWARGAAVAAVAACLAIVLALVIPTRRTDEGASPQSRQIDAVLAASDATTTIADILGGGTFSVVSSLGLAQAVVTVVGVPPVAADRTYELWVMRADSARSAGLTDQGAQILVHDVTSADVLGLTIEPAGGSERPTTDPLVAVPV